MLKVFKNSWYLFAKKGRAGAGAETAPAPGFLQGAGAENGSLILVAAPQPCSEVILKVNDHQFKNVMGKAKNQINCKLNLKLEL